MAAPSESHTRIPLLLNGAMLTHPGAVRSTNQDTVAYFLPGPENPDSRNGSLALVADGVGGHAAGEIASQIAVKTIGQLYYSLDGEVPELLAASFSAANEAIWQRSQSDPDCAGMGTTCTAIAVKDNHAFLAHIGDSRAYILRDNRCHQLSDDHSLVAELVRKGSITRDEAKRSPQRNIILRALGTKPHATPKIWQEGLPLLAGDILVLCSDGLTDGVHEATIKAIAACQPPYEACKMLVEAALASGGHDNISIGLFVIADAEPARQAGDTGRYTASHQVQDEIPS
jgi:protein phosphatase